jgi:hypothetical protein
MLRERFINQPVQETKEINPMEEFWQAQQESYALFREKGAQALFDGIENIQQYFEPDGTICCIDERVPGTLHSAGSLVLLPEAEARAYIEKSGAKKISSHSGCGAMKVAYMQEHGLTDGNIDPELIDAYAIEKTRQLAEKYGLEYIGNHDYEKMQGPKEFHHARVIYYVDTPVAFNPLTIPGLLPGFVINRAFLSPEEAAKETALAQGIAFGGHGFAERFLKDPLLIICLGDQPETLRQELQATALTGKYPSVIDTATLHIS